MKIYILYSSKYITRLGEIFNDLQINNYTANKFNLGLQEFKWKI